MNDSRVTVGEAGGSDPAVHPAPLIVWAGLALLDAQAAPRAQSGVCIVGERVVDVGSRNDLCARYPAATLVGGEDMLLLPGLINSHDHGRGLSTLALGVTDDLLELWLLGLSALPAVDPYKLALIEGVNLLRSGVTATAHSHNPADWAAMAVESASTLLGYAETGIRVAYHPPYIDQNVLVYADRDAFLEGLPDDVRALAAPFLRLPALGIDGYLALCSDLYARHHDAAGQRVHIQVSPAGGQWCSDELMLACRDWAVAHGTRVQMHFLETVYQERYAYRRWGKSFLRHLEEIDMLGPWLTLAHMIWVEEADIPLLQAHGVAIAHNPSSNLRIRSGLAPLAAYHAAQLPIGIGLDGYALDDDQDYLRELRMAWTLGNRPGASAPTLAPADILHMGTAGGAAVTFGAGAPLGRLQAGMLADLVLVDWRAVEGVWVSALTPPQHLLLRRATREHVRDVMVAGEWVVRGGRSTRIDEAALLDEVRADLVRAASSQSDQGIQAARALAPYLRRFYAHWEAA